MYNTTKLRSAHSAIVENTSTKANIQNILTCRPLSQRRPLPTTPGPKHLHPLLNSTGDDHANEILTHSILVDNAARRRGFLPYYYRTANTFEAIRRQRIHYKPSSKLPPTFLSLFKRASSRSPMSENLTSITSELTQLNLIIHDKSMVKTPVLSPSHEKQDKGFINMHETEFVTEIPNSLELVLQNSPRKSTMERHLLETLKRQQLEHTRYRTLPINRAPYA